jgi:chromosome segregation ATPase
MVALRKEVATLQDELDANRALIDRQRGQLELLKQQLADRETELRRLLAELTLVKFHARTGQDATGSDTSEDND